jgi:hypothetical protein
MKRQKQTIYEISTRFGKDKRRLNLGFYGTKKALKKELMSWYDLSEIDANKTIYDVYKDHVTWKDVKTIAGKEMFITIETQLLWR